MLSNSWTSANPNFTSGQIIQAINNARTQGRGGLGSIVVFSSGNFHPRPGFTGFNGVAFPANVNGVITVGAIDRNGNIHNYSSRGTEMDLVAPSGGVPGDVVTTDRMGDLGYNDGDNPNYAFEFNGTSAAAPQVSGVAALMLSVNPNLTEAQVRTILQNTATDMGASGFDNTFGYGRLNAQAAVEAALPTITGPSLVCTSNTTFTLQNRPAGTNVTWTRSRNLTQVSGQGTDSYVVAANSSTTSGDGWVRATLTGPCGDVVLPQRSFWVGLPLKEHTS
ncbi:MAG: S8 family peptidase [Cyclobacteriaceae bacterium]